MPYLDPTSRTFYPSQEERIPTASWDTLILTSRTFYPGQEERPPTASWEIVIRTKSFPLVKPTPFAAGHRDQQHTPPSFDLSPLLPLPRLRRRWILSSLIKEKETPFEPTPTVAKHQLEAKSFEFRQKSMFSGPHLQITNPDPTCLNLSSSLSSHSHGSPAFWTTRLFQDM